jgi:hypothetical protein
MPSTARELAEDGPQNEPFSMDGDVRLEVELAESPYLDAVRVLYPDHLENNMCLIVKGTCTTDVWADYWERKLRAQNVARQFGENT